MSIIRSGSTSQKILEVLKTYGPGSRTVYVIPEKAKWAVVEEGANRATRVYNNKSAAILRAKSIARKLPKTDVTVFAKDGTIERREKTLRGKATAKSRAKGKLTTLEKFLGSKTDKSLPRKKRASAKKKAKKSR